MSKNGYDRTDVVRREKVMIAGPMKLGAYRVRDPETDEFGELQFHMTYNNMVMAVMPAEAVKLLVNFAKSVHEGEPSLELESPDRVAELLEHNNAQLEENRAQRRQIKLLQNAITELTDNRAEDYLHQGDRLMLLEALEAAQ